MRTEKTVYSAPKAKCFEVNVQGVFCQSPLYGDPGAAGASQNYNNYDIDF